MSSNLKVYIGGANHALLDNTTVTPDNAVSTLPASNLKDRQVENKWRSTTATNLYQIETEYPSLEPIPTQVISMLNTNFSQQGTYTLYGAGPYANTDWGFPDFGDISDYDTTGLAPTIDGSGHIVWNNAGAGTITPNAANQGAAGPYPTNYGLVLEVHCSSYTSGIAYVDFGDNGTAPILTQGTSKFWLYNASEDLINGWSMHTVTGAVLTIDWMKIYPITVRHLDQPIIGRALVYGGVPWGCFPWDGYMDADDYAPIRKNFFAVLDKCYPLTQYLLRISDSTNPDGYYEAGLMYASGGFIPSAGKACDWTIDWKDDSKETKSEGGQTYVDEKNKRRVLKFKLPNLTRAEHHGMVQTIFRQVGKSKDIVAIPRPSDKSYHISEAIHGRLLKLGPSKKIDGTGVNERWEVTIEVEELV